MFACETLALKPANPTTAHDSLCLTILKIGIFAAAQGPLFRGSPRLAYTDSC